MAKKSVVITCVTATFFSLVFYVVYFDDGANTQQYLQAAFSRIADSSLVRQGLQANSNESNSRLQLRPASPYVAKILAKHKRRQASAAQPSQSKSPVTPAPVYTKHNRPSKGRKPKAKDNSTVTDQKIAVITNSTPSFPTHPSVILYSKYRTGSTFASSFLQKHSQYFFAFEPLHLVDPAKLTKDANYWLSEVLNCRFVDLHDEWMNSERFTEGLRRLWKRRTFCFKYGENQTCGARDIRDLEADCRSYSYTGTKGCPQT